MKKILIATRNNDKFKIVSKLLATKNFKDSNFYSLNDIEENIIDIKETGDIINRSLQKALNVRDCIKNYYDYIIGVDDGIKMKGKIVENVKDYIKLIIDDKYLQQDEKVFIVRAYTFVDKNGIYKSIVTEIPFKYKKLKEKFEILENSYPLSHVLSPIDSLKTVIQLNDDESNEYYLKFSQAKFEEVERFFDDK